MDYSKILLELDNYTFEKYKKDRRKNFRLGHPCRLAIEKDTGNVVLADANRLDMEAKNETQWPADLDPDITYSMSRNQYCNNFVFVAPYDMTSGQRSEYERVLEVSIAWLVMQVDEMEDSTINL